MTLSHVSLISATSNPGPDRPHATWGNRATLARRSQAYHFRTLSLYPRGTDDPQPESLRLGWLCPECLHVYLENTLGIREESHTCMVCDSECITVFVSESALSSRGGTGSAESRQYACPHCGSTQGLSLMGLDTVMQVF